MGFSLSWIAVNGKDSDTVLRELSLAPTAERDELPAESPVAGAALDGGWYVVVFDRYGHDLLDDEVLKRVSTGCALVAAAVEEHVMCSFAGGWRDGERLWRIEHDADQGLEHLVADGSPPPGFDALRTRLLEAQAAAGGDEADVDYVFDVPLEAAKLVTGFSHHEAEPEGGFVVLAPTGR